MLEKLKKPNAKISATQFEKITGQKCTKANIEKFKKGKFSTANQKVNSYQEGQEMAVDVTADVVSGVASFGIYTAAVAAAPFTGGASIAVGVAAAAGTGALLKSGIKAADTYSGGRKYTSDNFIKDSATGAVSGVLAPITGGFGGAVGKTVATKVGLQTVKTVGKEIAEDVVETGFKQSLKSSLLNPGAYKYVGDGIGKKALAYSAEVLADGTVNGGIDNGFRTAINGGSLSDVAKAAGEGALYAPLVGLGMKGIGKISSKISKNTKEYDFVNTPAEKREALLKQYAKEAGVSKKQFEEYNISFNEEELIGTNINTPQRVKLLNNLINNKERKFSFDEIMSVLSNYNIDEYIDSMDLAKLLSTKNKNGEYIFDFKPFTRGYLTPKLLETIKTNPEIIDKSFMDLYTFMYSKPKYYNYAQMFLDNVKNRDKSISIDIYVKNKVSEIYDSKSPNIIKEEINKIEDKTLVNMLTEKLGKLNFQEINLKNIDHNDNELHKVVNIIDIYNNLTNKYTTLRDVDYIEANAKRYMDYLKTSDRETYIGLKNENLLSSDGPDMDDVLKNAQIEPLTDYCKNNNDKISNYLYETYYVKQTGEPKLKELSDKYGTKIFLSEHWHQDPNAINKIEKELETWSKISNGKATMPPVIDLTTVKVAYIDSSSAYGQGAAAGFSESHSNKGISINGIDVAPTTIRHEMTHSNDLKRVYKFPSEFIDEMTRQQAVRGEIKPKYWEEFEKAGIPEYHIPYAYNNPEEFIAVASEGDMSKYSNEFKKILIEFGMPKWELDFPPIN